MCMANQGRGISHARERLDKINELWDSVNSNRITGILRDKLIAEFCLKYGTRRRTVLEYLKILIDAGKIEFRNGRLF